MGMSIGAWASIAALVCAAPAQAGCPVVDAFQDFMVLSARTAALPADQQTLAFRSDYLARRRELYTPEVLPGPTGAVIDASALKAMKRVREHPEWRAFDLEFKQAFRRVAIRFAGEFPDFRCDFPVYATETFGFMDGAGRVVAGRPSLVFGVDTIAQSWTREALPVFLSHELFHRYHFQAAGFSDDLGDRDLIWRSLWAEGLATYVSARLNPTNPLSDALITPKDLEAQAKPFVPQMAAELLAAADRSDAKTFAKFFEGGDAEARRLGWPSRSGYYIGYLVAEDLGRRRSLKALAHIKGPELRSEIGEALARLSHDQGA
jgi:hypothetical protein